MSFAGLSIKKDALIAVMGMTGVGKSSFISAVTNKNVKIGHSLQSCTQEIELTKCRIGDYNVTFIDTPGFDDTDRSDTDVLQSIATYLKLSNDKKQNLAGLIYLHRITDARVTGSAMKNLKMFRTLCGDNNLTNVVLVTSMWDNVAADVGQRRERELISTGNFWGGMIRMGARAARWDKTTKSARDIVLKIVHLAPIVLLIQDELNTYNTLENTTAGKEVQRNLEKEMANWREEMKMFAEQLLEAQRTNNAALLAESRMLHEAQIAGLQRAHNDMLKLSKDQTESMRQRINGLQSELDKMNGGCTIS
ncbi:hypothetical protein RUND412_006869 [Rhizina undulata]